MPTQTTALYGRIVTEVEPWNLVPYIDLNNLQRRQLCARRFIFMTYKAHRRLGSQLIGKVCC